MENIVMTVVAKLFFNLETQLKLSLSRIVERLFNIVSRKCRGSSYVFQGFSDLPLQAIVSSINISQDKPQMKMISIQLCIIICKSHKL